ncbi:MAG: FAD-dependent oxidoreductase [Thermomicrobiales bacterium]
MPQTAGAIIIGGGIMGASLAFALARRGLRDVLVLEKRTVASGASGKTGALLRQHYSNRPEATLAHLSHETFRNWGEIIGGSCDYVECGLIATVAMSGPDDPNVARMRANIALQNSVGIRSEAVTADDLRRLQPFGNFDDIVIAAHEPASGYVDAIAATRSMMDAAIDRGAQLREGVAVTAIRTAHGRVTGVDTSDGPIDAPLVICATGPWSVPLLATVGVAVPIEPLRVQVAIVNRPNAMPRTGTMAYVDTAANFFCRDWGANRTMVGIGGGEFHDTADPDAYDERPDPTMPPLAIANLARRMPAMAASTPLYGHAGLYDMTPDAHPIIGPVPGLDGLYLSIGYSGAGFKKGPAVGQALAELILDGRATTADLAPFHLARFATDAWRTPWGEHEYTFSSDFGHGF